MTASIVLVAFTFLLAGSVKGLFGMGLPTVSMGLLALTMPPVQAAALLVVPTIATNVWQLAGPGLGALVVRFGLMIVAMCIGTVLGSNVLTGGPAPLVSQTLGAVLIVYSSVGLFRKPTLVPPAAERWLSPVIGLIAGVVNGATGIAAVPLVPYVASLGLSRDSLIQTLGLMFTTAMVALAACLAWTGNLPVTSMGTSLLSLLPVALGMWIGQMIRVRLQAHVFQRWFFAGLLLLGSYMVLRSL